MGTCLLAPPRVPGPDRPPRPDRPRQLHTARPGLATKLPFFCFSNQSGLVGQKYDGEGSLPAREGSMGAASAATGPRVGHLVARRRHAAPAPTASALRIACASPTTPRSAGSTSRAQHPFMQSVPEPWSDPKIETARASQAERGGRAALAANVHCKQPHTIFRVETIVYLLLRQPVLDPLPHRTQEPRLLRLRLRPRLGRVLPRRLTRRRRRWRRRPGLLRRLALCLLATSRALHLRPPRRLLACPSSTRDSVFRL